MKYKIIWHIIKRICTNINQIQSEREGERGREGERTIKNFWYKIAGTVVENFFKHIQSTRERKKCKVCVMFEESVDTRRKESSEKRETMNTVDILYTVLYNIRRL